MTSRPKASPTRNREPVTSVRPANLLGSRLLPGDNVAEVADLSSIRARLFVSDSAMRDVRLGQSVNLRPDSLFSSLGGTVDEIAPASSEMESGLQAKEAYKGLAPPQYFVLTVVLPNAAGDLRYGMTGTAKVYVRRGSVVGLVWRLAGDFVRRKLW